MEKIFGVDPKSKFTAEDVRDAIVECFYQAHKEVAEKQFQFAGEDFGEEALKKMTSNFTEGIVRRAFTETSGDFSQPTKASLQKAIDYMKEFAMEFRTKEIIDANYQQIKSLIDGLSE
ncbi:MAG: hypothetical protein H6760_00585 [Candidatus Nomurabacteria bacterium]|nr:MAG: hypothetical protein H6760_00585 [Candidatus Nomurabacteria bacterium]